MFRTVFVKFRDTKRLYPNNPTQGWCQGLWSGSHVLSSADMESKTTLESGLDSWGHPSSVSVVLTSLTVASFMWRVTCYCEQLCLNRLCSCSASTFGDFKRTSPSMKERLVWTSRLSVCDFYRELNSVSHFHEIQYITSLQTAVRQPPVPWKSAQWQTYIT